MEYLCGSRLEEEDAVAIGRLPESARLEVLSWLDVLRPAVEMGRSGRGARIAAAARTMGVPAKTARRRFDAYVRRGWRGLLDGRKAGAGVVRGGLGADDEAAFLEWVKGLAENYGGNLRKGVKAAVGAWRAGMEIPGYGERPAAGVAGVPTGWSYANLARAARLTRHERAVASVGRAAGRVHASMVLRTRVGLVPGQIYQADDVWHDVLCAMIGRNGEPVRPMELCMLDLATAHKIAYGMKPRRTDEETGKRINLRGTDMRFLVAHVFCNVGYSAAGCTLMLEHGTASTENRVEEILARFSGGAIRVATGGVQDAPALLGAWSGIQKGNPKFKAAIESSHRLIHTAARWLPGQTGGNSRENMPEELAGRGKEFEKLCKALAPALQGMDEERVAWLEGQLAMPFVPYAAYVRIVGELYDIIGTERDHDLEGWEECGYVTSGFRTSLGGDVFPWSVLDRVSAEEATAIRAMVRLNPTLQVTRRMSRAEAWATARLRRLPMEAFCEICGPDLAVERKVRDHAFRFEDGQIQRGRTFSFPAVARDSFGREILLRDGEKYATLHDPFDPEVLYVLDAHFRVVGRCSHQVVASQADMESLHRAMGEAAHLEAVALAGYRARHEDQAGSVAAMRARNEAVLAEVATTGTARREEMPRREADAVRTALLEGGRGEEDDPEGGESGGVLDEIFAT